MTLEDGPNITDRSIDVDVCIEDRDCCISVGQGHVSCLYVASEADVLAIINEFSKLPIIQYLLAFPKVAYTTTPDGKITITHDDDRAHYLLSMPGARL